MGADGEKAAILTWHQRLGHSSFKTVVVSARNGVSGYGNNGPTNGFNACAACVAATSVHLPHKEGRGWVREYLEQVHIDISSPVPPKLLPEGIPESHREA